MELFNCMGFVNIKKRLRAVCVKQVVAFVVILPHTPLMTASLPLGQMVS